jgi:hypothetical protein
MKTSEKKDPKNVHPGILALREILRGMRNDAQGGYDGVSKKHKFANHAYSHRGAQGLGFAKPEQLDALFALAGIVPDPIEINGSCTECIYGDATTRGDMGWAQPCCSCSRPKMTNFVSLAAVKDSALRITDDEAQLLRNAKAHEWWATGIVTVGVNDPRTSKRNKQIEHCYRIEAKMKKRDMIANCMSSRRLTRKGLRALKLHEGAGAKIGKGAA